MALDDVGGPGVHSPLNWESGASPSAPTPARAGSRTGDRARGAIRKDLPLLQDYLSVTASRLADKVALVCGKRRSTYRELDEASNAIAHALISRGVTRGDRVIVFASNTIETVVSFWAALKADAVVSLVNPLTKAGKLAYLIDDCRPAAIITDARLRDVWIGPSQSLHLKCVIVSGALDAGRFGRVPRLLRWDDALALGERSRPPAHRNIDLDLASIIYTSGSTGEPKGVMMTHRNMLATATSVAAYLEVREDDVILGVLPLSFSYGLYQMILAVRQGGRLVLEDSFGFPAQVLKRVVDEGVTGFPGVPTIFAILAEMSPLKSFDLSKIRYVTSSGAALPVKHIAALQALFPAARIFSMYGLTECKRCTYLPPEDLHRKPTSVGIPIPNTEIWIVDEDGRKVPPGTVGQLVVRGATVMKGYWGKPEATARRLRPGPLPGEQVLYTGDYCEMDDEGYLYFVGRMDDMIKSRGEKVSPVEVETALVDIDGIKDVAVVGVPDPLLGEAVKAFVVLDRGISMTERDIQCRCRETLESLFVPKYIQFVAELPRTETGKVSKLSLRPRRDRLFGSATGARARMVSHEA